MRTSQSSLLPDRNSLISGLTSVFSNRNGRGPLTVVHRRACDYSSTFPSEIVTCKFDGKQKHRVLCKYARKGFYTGHGHRGGVIYEAEVYRHVLQPGQISVPMFYGTYRDSRTDGTWLIIEYLANSQRVTKPPGAVFEAARWIGRFHAMNEARLSASPIPWLKRYDADYYRGWVRRTRRFGGRLRSQSTWLPKLCERFMRVLPLLLDAPQTIIHGEFYVHNVLVQEGSVYPVDWESAAIGPGEIDLAALTEGWDLATVRRCEVEYATARWAGRSPDDFQRTLDTARLYLCFRWLGDERESTSAADSAGYFQMARALGEGLALI